MSKKNSKPRAKASPSTDPGTFGISDVNEAQVKFSSPNGARNKYNPIFNRLTEKKAGEGMTITVPANVDPVAFKNNITSAIHNRIGNKKNPLSLPKNTGPSIRLADDNKSLYVGLRSVA